MGQGSSALVAPRHGGLPRVASQGPAPIPPDTDHSGLSFNRDLSLIEFYRRVLDEARDETNPLLERAKFLGIVGTSLHEFAVTRCAELRKESGAFFARRDERGTRPLFLTRIEAEVKDLLADARSYLREQSAPAPAS